MRHPQHHTAKERPRGIDPTNVPLVPSMSGGVVLAERQRTIVATLRWSLAGSRLVGTRIRAQRALVSLGPRRVHSTCRLAFGGFPMKERRPARHRDLPATSNLERRGSLGKA